MFKRFLATAALVMASAFASAAQFEPNKDYYVVPVPGQVDKPGVIEVREFFWYGCGHCFNLEKHIVAWKKTMPANVNFVRTPAALNPVWEENARAYYIAETKGVVEKAHGPLFNAIHLSNQRIFDRKSLAKFYEKYGVSQKDFDGLYKSFAVNGKVTKSQNLAKFYKLDGVPAVVVNGKYIIRGADSRVPQIINFLVAKEAAAAKK